jgi:ZIP family zinc transporter
MVENLILLGLIASLLAGLGTAVGALPALFMKKVSNRALDTMLGGAAGVMLAATSFSLVVPAIEYGSQMWSPVTGVMVAVIGLFVGALFLDIVEKWIPHQHFFKGREGPSSSLRKTWLFVLAITIHNFPEGMAVGVGFGSGDIGAATALAIGIGLQNMPEGLAVALPMLREKYSRGAAFLVAALTGMVEPIGGLLGVSLVVIFKPVLPFALAFAGGAMLFVISDEIIPETHSRGNERLATFGVVIGFLIMMALDNLLG